MVTDESIRSLVRGRWHRGVQACVAVCATGWRLTSDGTKLLATVTPEAAGLRLAAGLSVAEHLAGLGFPVAEPLRTADGALVVPVDGGVLSVVRPVPGRPLDPRDPVDQQWWGNLLGAAHTALTDFTHPHVVRREWLKPDGAHLDVVPWVRPAVTAAVGALTRLTVTDRLTYGVLHGDPAPEAFRLDPETGAIGLADWRVPATGPLAYDLAAAVGYAGGLAAAAELLDGYRSTGPLCREEAEAAVPVLLGYWLAERVDGLARRLAAGDGAADRAALDAARDAWEELVKTTGGG